ncbi:hypothetical protein RvY_14932-3 [Ramazzottius varieornatus]|uniref:MARVEL domain-containing protein n=1 Tax=Ramazzottius varieornatus TaxID=947166 RepID=A0A1D1VSZ0_RAMVA|nr:hypothetical protein RvY_14932-3 [Ramazzottius varieornatus]
MVTTTTKTLNYSIIRGNHTNSVNATITSTPGFNINYFGKIPGILKVLELILTVIGIGLVGSMRDERQLQVVTSPAGAPAAGSYYSYRREMFMSGEVYYLCVHSIALAMLLVILMAYAFHTVSSMLTPKGTQVENIMNMVLAILLLIAGIVEIVQTENFKRDDANRDLMTSNEYGVRIAAGVIALINGILFIISFVLSKKELDGPKAV